jgi:hypothetical protein
MPAVFKMFATHDVDLATQKSRETNGECIACATKIMEKSSREGGPDQPITKFPYVVKGRCLFCFGEFILKWCLAAIIYIVLLMVISVLGNTPANTIDPSTSSLVRVPFWQKILTNWLRIEDILNKNQGITRTP